MMKVYKSLSQVSGDTIFGCVATLLLVLAMSLMK